MIGLDWRARYEGGRRGKGVLVVVVVVVMDVVEGRKVHCMPNCTSSASIFPERDACCCWWWLLMMLCGCRVLGGEEATGRR